MAKRIARRSFLRGSAAGAAVAVALPTFECMLNSNGSAYADGSPIPKRFIAWHWANGMQTPHWVPSAVDPDDGQDPRGALRSHFDGPRWLPAATSLGSNYRRSTELGPIFDAGVNDRVTVVSGTGVGRDRGHIAHAHGLFGLLYDEVTENDDQLWVRPTNPAASTFVQQIADAVRGDAPFGLTRLQVNRTPKGKAEPHSEAFGSHDPATLYQQLFGAGEIPAADPGQVEQAEWQRAREADVLGAVLEDTRALRRQLGAADRARLDRHLTSLSDIQRRIRNGVALDCTVPEAPAPSAPWSERQYEAEDLEARDELFLDIVIAAFRCDLTRACQYTFSVGQHNAIFANHSAFPVDPNIPSRFGTFEGGRDAGSGHHSNSHSNHIANGLFHHRATTFTMSRFAALVTRLQEVTVGDRDLLHHTGVFAWSEQENYAPQPGSVPESEYYNLYNSNNHRHDHVPILIAGEAGGSLVSGIHHQPPGGITYAGRLEQSSRVILSLMHAYGIPKASWGNGPRRRTEPFAELLAG
ncbi:MAG: DUF1552 domain-containing protein [Myxococcota bacterium]